MKRILVVGAVLVTVLVGLVGWKIRAQQAVNDAPSGGSGLVEGTEVDAASLAGGRVLTVHVRQGDSVAAGQLLLSIDCTEANAALEEAEARVAMAEAQVGGARAQADAVARSTRVNRAQAAVARAQAGALQAQHDAAARDLERLERLGNAVTPQNVDQTRAQTLALEQQRLAALDTAGAQGAQAQVTLANAEAASAQADAAGHQLAAARTGVVRARQIVADCEVKAPRAGLVDDVFYEVGELAPRGAPLVRIVDIATVKATFYLPNAELAAARPGGTALVSADAYPGRTWHGTVTSVSAEAAFTPRNVQTRTDRDRLVYPVEVRVENADGRLRPGMPVEITLPGTERGHR